MFKLIVESIESKDVHDASSREELLSIVGNLNVKTVSGSLHLNNGNYLVFSCIPTDSIVDILDNSKDSIWENLDEEAFQAAELVQSKDIQKGIECI